MSTRCCPWRTSAELVWAERRDGGWSTIARALVDFEGDRNWSAYEMAIEIEPDGETKVGEFVVGLPPPLSTS